MSSTVGQSRRISEPNDKDAIRPASMRSTYVLFVKPTVDRFAGVVLLVVLAPFIAVAGLAVYLSLGRPVLYRQRRVGLGGNTFVLYKLRTMAPDRRRRDERFAGPERRRRHKTKADPRVPPVGSRLRSLRLDELPQLWNLVKGDMSLVGPRPELPAIVANYDGWQHLRHSVKPGLTGLWQISDLNGAPMHECTQLDVKYVFKVGPVTDLSILLRTPIAMIRRPGY